MYQQGRKLLPGFGIVVDLALCTASLLFASAKVTQPFWRKEAVIVEHPITQALLLAALILGWHLSLLVARLYRSFRLANLLQRSVALASAMGLATICTGLWLSLHVLASEGRLEWNSSMTLELVLFAVIATISLLIARVTLELMMRSMRRRGRNLRYVLVLGSNRRAVRTADAITRDPALGYRVVGFVDDTWHAPCASGTYKSMLVGGITDFPELLRTLAVDEVMIALPIASFYSDIRKVFHLCTQQGVPVRCEASLFEPAELRADGGETPLQFITLHQSAWSQWALSLKRTIDFTLALGVLLSLLPVLLCIAVAVKLSSPGPIFFLQERLGQGKRRFKICKFRTMVVDAEKRMREVEHLNQSQGPTFKLSDDPRVTSVGSFLRKTSLDELPQLLNVLLGDMSVVGPRPLPMRDYRGFSEDWHRRRFSVRPGITCLWQVMGRSSIGFERWMELDMNYIDSWSLWLDLKIIFQTIPAVLRGSGAM